MKLKTSLPVIWLENIDKKSGSVRTQWTKLILVDPVEDEDSSTDWSSKRLTIRSKEMEEYYSLILIESIITLLYIGFGKYF